MVSIEDRLDEKLDAMLERRLAGNCLPRERGAVALIHEEATDDGVIYWITTRNNQRKESKTRFFLVDFLMRNRYV
jgi:hypothetical protein